MVVAAARIPGERKFARLISMKQLKAFSPFPPVSPPGSPRTFVRSFVSGSSAIFSGCFRNARRNTRYLASVIYERINDATMCRCFSPGGVHLSNLNRPRGIFADVLPVILPRIHAALPVARLSERTNERIRGCVQHAHARTLLRGDYRDANT